MRNTYPTPRASPAPFSAYSFLQSSNHQNVDIGCQPGEDIRPIHDLQRPPANGIHTATESPDQVMSSLTKWEATQNLDRNYFNTKDRMIKKIDAITACLSLEPQVDGLVRSANAPPTANLGRGAGGEPTSLDTLNSIEDYGYSLRNYIAAGPADDSNFLAGISVRKVSTLPGFLRGIPSPSGLGTGAAGEKLEQDWELEEGYEDSGWEVVAGAVGRG